ncbi:AraC family transcriptional regulator [Litoribrevibacter albus]|uniref:AraC family transcriptional regulator n=1 Tax=Litoribrevibacter albus TaxID=1473156 RepID=A0AA37W749_9GAMM|nr:AraC family transcriptional regulator [Litoribrevibacter albus]GLQ30251.1 AraC family transcriptional regulator [Litoribrevibacter albus]
MHYSTLASWSLAIVKALDKSGIDGIELLAKAGLDYEAIQLNPEARIPIEQMTQVWLLAEVATQNPAFGLTVSSCVNPLHFRALGMLMMTSHSIAETFEKVVKYYSLISNTGLVELEHTPDLLGFKIQPLEGVVISTLAIDAFFASVVVLCEQVLNSRSFIHSVELIKPEPKNKTAWQTFFQCSVKFNADTNCLWMKRDILEASSAFSDSRMAVYSESVIQDYLETMKQGAWRDRVMQAIHAAFTHGEPSLADIAAQLEVSERSLSRRLKEEQTSFRALLSEKRKELAQFYLKNSELPVTEIAYKLGFSDVSNFTRACQGWFDCAPSVYRKTS